MIEVSSMGLWWIDPVQGEQRSSPSLELWVFQELQVEMWKFGDRETKSQDLGVF